MATINARIDDAVKLSADEVLEILDISHTQAITALYQYIAENKKLPFTIITSVKTPDDLTLEVKNTLSEALAVAFNLQAWILQHDKMDGYKLWQYHRRLDIQHASAKEKIILLAEPHQALQTLNALNKVLTTIVDVEDFGRGSTLVKFSKPEKNNCSSAITDLEKSLRALFDHDAGTPE